MRSSLLASLALTATLTSAFAPSIADACGGYGGERLPAVFAVDVHFSSGNNGEAKGRRAFVLFASAAPTDKVTWTRLAPMTFDYTRIADAPDSTHPTTVTLIGPSGTRVVKSKDRTFIADSFRSRREQTAMEIGVGANHEFSIAVLGEQPDATWLGTSNVTATKQTLAWVRTQGVTTDSVYVAKIKGTKLRVISAYPEGSSSLTSFILDGTTTLTASSGGHPIGAVELGGKRYVLFEEQGMITPVAV